MRDSRISLTVALALWACLTGASFADESTVRKIENMISTTSETQTTKVKLERCKLLVVNASLVNCSERNTPSEQASKVARAVWEIDLTTVDRVRVAPVRDKMHIEFWPAKKNFLSNALGRPTSVRQTKTMYHCNGDAYEQDEGIAVSIMVPKAPESDLSQLLSHYIATYCD